MKLRRIEVRYNCEWKGPFAESTLVFLAPDEVYESVRSIILGLPIPKIDNLHEMDASCWFNKTGWESFGKRIMKILKKSRIRFRILEYIATHDEIIFCDNFQAVLPVRSKDLTLKKEFVCGPNVTQ